MAENVVTNVGLEAAKVTWRSVLDDPSTGGALARFFDNELGEWVYTVIWHGPVKHTLAAPYMEWLPLDLFNGPLYLASPIVTDEMVERAGAAIWGCLVGPGIRLTRDDVANYSDAARAALIALAPPHPGD